MAQDFEFEVGSNNITGRLPIFPRDTRKLLPKSSKFTDVVRRKIAKFIWLESTPPTYPSPDVMSVNPRMSVSFYPLLNLPMLDSELLFPAVVESREIYELETRKLETQGDELGIAELDHVRPCYEFACNIPGSSDVSAPILPMPDET